jgi:hypothetical protein
VAMLLQKQINSWHVGGNYQFTGIFWRFIMELLHVHISFSGNTFVRGMLRVSVIEVIHH